MKTKNEGNKDFQLLYTGLVNWDTKLIIAAIKRINKLNVILENVPLTRMLTHLNNDRACEEVFAELFKLHVEKVYKP